MANNPHALLQFRSELYRLRKTIRAFSNHCDQLQPVQWDIDFHPHEIFPLFTISSTPCPDYPPVAKDKILKHLECKDDAVSLRKQYQKTASEFLDSLTENELVACSLYQPNDIIEALSKLETLILIKTKFGDDGDPA